MGYRPRSLSHSVKAAWIEEYGGPDVIRYGEIPRPSPGPGEILLRVAGASFNPADIGDRSGRYRQVPLPFTLGFDVAGQVDEVGPDVNTLSPGDSVIARLDGGGACAEYALAHAKVVARAPDELPLADAAAIPLAGLTAWQVVFEHGRVKAGQRVLINGAGGGVGGFAIQLAKRTGAYVIATASARSADQVRTHGADQVVDYTVAALPEAVREPVDAVLNLVPISPEAGTSIVDVVRSGGMIASITGKIDAPSSTAVTSVQFITRNDPAILDELVHLVDAGELSVDISERLPLSQVAEVHRRSEQGDVRGKVILLPRGSSAHSVRQSQPDSSGAGS
jgi:NADPH:quinone reductase-like Zn-dependent oxidoreductase